MVDHHGGGGNGRSGGGGGGDKKGTGISIFGAKYSHEHFESCIKKGQSIRICFF